MSGVSRSDPAPATSGVPKDETVKVLVRCRPFIARQKRDGEQQAVFIDNDQITLVDPRHDDDADPDKFNFDTVFQMDSTQEQVYNQSAAPLVEALLDGYNGTMLAYGQTSSGKTFTMDGTSENPGIMRRCFEDVFAKLDCMNTGNDPVFLVKAQYVQIYMEEVYDLLATRKRQSNGPGERLKIRNHANFGFYVEGAVQRFVTSPADALHVLEHGLKARVVAATAMNDTGSSRSHAVFTLTLERKDAKSELTGARLNFVDLAGSDTHPAEHTHSAESPMLMPFRLGRDCCTVLLNSAECC